MARVGIVGGLGPESTIDYYRRIVAAWEQEDPSTAPSIVKGEFREDTRQGFSSLVARLRDEESIDGVILGGTELPVLLSMPVIAGVPVLDTTALHVTAIVKRLRHIDAPPSNAPAPAE